GLIIVDNVAYGATAPSCDAAPNAIMALNLESKETATFKPESGSIVGADGPSIGPDGTVYVATTAGDLVALAAKTLKVKDVYKAGAAFSSTPVIFEHKGKVVIAAATKDGRVHLLDTASLGTPLVKSNAGSSAPIALATWQDAGGARWLAGSAGTNVATWKVA